MNSDNIKILNNPNKCKNMKYNVNYPPEILT